MSRKILTLLLATALLLSGCKSKSENATVAANSDTTVVQQEPAVSEGDNEAYEGDEITEEQLVDMLSQSKLSVDTINLRKQQVERLLKDLSTAMADSTYTTFRQEQDNSSNYLNTLNADWLYEPMYTKRYNGIVNAIEKADMEVQGVGEGYYEIKFSAYYFYNIFKDHVSAEQHDYLKIQADQDTTLFMADAGICISWNDLGEWLVAWEKQIDKYPQGNRLADAKEQYRWLLDSYIFGSDNTRPFEFDEKGKVIIYESEAYNKLMKKYPKSRTAKVVAALLSKLKTAKVLDGDGYSGLRDSITESVGQIIDRW